MNFNHKSVLLNESIDALNIKEDGIYVDGTAGGGGHSVEILKRLKTGKLVLIDQDPDAIDFLKEKFNQSKNVYIVKDNFSNMDKILENLNIYKVDGVLLDIGVSSYQLDTPERGFSYHNDAALDMRMSKSGISAFDVVNKFSYEELSKIIFTYGEEKYSRLISKVIILRLEEKISTLLERLFKL